MRSRKVIRVLFWAVIIFNLPPLCNIINLFGNEYSYVTKQGRWIYENQFAGQRYEDAYSTYWYNKREPGYEHDAPLYRIAAINPLKFWRWYDYAVHPRWRLLYNDQPDTLRKGPVNPNPEKVKLWNRMQAIDETL